MVFVRTNMFCTNLLNVKLALAETSGVVRILRVEIITIRIQLCNLTSCILLWLPTTSEKRWQFTNDGDLARHRMLAGQALAKLPAPSR